MIHLQLAFVNAELGSKVTPTDYLLVSRSFLLESGIALGGAHGIPPESIHLRYNPLYQDMILSKETITWWAEACHKRMSKCPPRKISQGSIIHDHINNTKL